jgi:hypothetical protein
VVQRTARRRREEAAALGLVWPKEEESAGQLGGHYVRTVVANRLGWKQGVWGEFRKRRKNQFEMDFELSKALENHIRRIWGKFEHENFS